MLIRRAGRLTVIAIALIALAESSLAATRPPDHASIGAGDGNAVTAFYSFVGAGVNNVASGHDAFLGASGDNSVASDLGFVGAGFHNLITPVNGSNHLGPMAQDFYAAFRVGEDDRHITTSTKAA